MKNQEAWIKRGEMLKQARLAKGLFQKDIADFLGVATNTITGYEKGTRKIDFDDLKKLCRFYGLKMENF